MGFLLGIVLQGWEEYQKSDLPLFDVFGVKFLLIREIPVVFLDYDADLNEFAVAIDTDSVILGTVDFLTSLIDYDLDIEDGRGWSGSRCIGC